MTDYKSLPSDLKKKLAKAVHVIQNDIPIIVGQLAVNHFRASFRHEGFLNGGRKKWTDVKRRDPKSPWYGFEYKGEKRTFYKLTRDRKTKKTSKAKKQEPLNFSKAATLRKPLLSKRSTLYNSLKSKSKHGRVIISTNVPYAKVQNEGGTIKVFGKHPVKLPARPFMGESLELNKKVENRVNKIFNKILS